MTQLRPSQSSIAASTLQPMDDDLFLLGDSLNDQVLVVGIQSIKLGQTLKQGHGELRARRRNAVEEKVEEQVKQLRKNAVMEFALRTPKGLLQAISGVGGAVLQDGGLKTGFQNTFSALGILSDAGATGYASYADSRRQKMDSQVQLGLKDYDIASSQMHDTQQLIDRWMQSVQQALHGMRETTKAASLR